MDLHPAFRRAFHAPTLCLALIAVGWACSVEPEVDERPGGDGDGPPVAASGGSDAGDGDGDGDNQGDGDLSFGSGGAPAGAGGSGGGMGGSGPVCETTSSAAELAPIFLAVAFDVSGSMGHYDYPRWWHDPEAKWKPVVDATTAFFEDPSSEGISASMALFPFGEQEGRCDAETYASPEVEMVALPSTKFASTFSSYEAEVGSPLAGGDWRGGTPTVFAFEGTADYLSTFVEENDEAKFAVVLVTDGLPQGCDDEQDIPVVAARVAELYDGGAGVATYVIGIENPTIPPDAVPDEWDDWGCGEDLDEACEPPDTLEDLNEVAKAGGTDQAFLIDTGDPQATKEEFRAAIDAIRSRAISCELGIPEHPVDGMSFDKDKINVSLSVDQTTTSLTYDPECQEDSSWRYDDEEQAQMIELCPETCSQIQMLPGAALNVDFLCEPRPDVIR